MTSQETASLEILDRLSAQSKVIRRAAALAAGVPSSALTSLTRRGKLRRVGRGLYQLADAEGYEHPDLVEVALQSPKGVIVLLSALSFHGVGTHPAREVWLQLPANFPAPR
ncbi:MAG: type IV toxin-antitoxin system AbiEi family antitoxin domain-containing protein, partial [Verrucomicrobiae bacterium]|nr:type IV toxin-antitoxin system AbiEi family antitoxin domain-containing protein [Verrucomicrobiae bacterium]